MCATIRVSERWTAFASVRYDRSGDYGDFLSPGFGFVFEPSHIYRLKLYAGRAFRAPTFNDLYWPIYGNEGLAPEEGLSFESTLEVEPSDRLELKLSGFYRNTENLIAWMPDILGLWKPTNVNEATVKGVEVSLNVVVTPALNVALRGSYNAGRQRRREVVYSDGWTGETRFEEIERDLAFLPGYTASAEADWVGPQDVHFNVRATSVGERVNYYADYSASPNVEMLEKRLERSVLLSAFLGYEFIEGIEAFLWGENLLDANYADQFGTSIDDRDYPRPGRTVGLGVRFYLTRTE